MFDLCLKKKDEKPHSAPQRLESQIRLANFEKTTSFETSRKPILGGRPKSRGEGPPALRASDPACLRTRHEKIEY